MIGEDVSENNETEKYLDESKRNGKTVPFNKSGAISFVKIGSCHMCRAKSKLVYQCHRSYVATSCEKKFCYDCLVLIYKDNIVENLQKTDVWKCPYARKICRCKNCCTARKEVYSVLQLDPNQTVYANLRMKAKNQGDDENQDDTDETMRCLLRERTRKLLDFNGQLINKVNTHYHKLSEDEIKFYNKLIHSNLTVLNAAAKNMVVNQTLIEQ